MNGDAEAQGGSEGGDPLHDLALGDERGLQDAMFAPPLHGRGDTRDHLASPAAPVSEKFLAYLFAAIAICMSRCLRFSCRLMKMLASRIPEATAAMMMVASALISGLRPRRTREKTSMGKVVAPGPVVKLEITTSSRERVKASSQPETMAGAMMGKVMTKKVFSGRHPRSS